jgi:urea transport system permease protein
LQDVLQQVQPLVANPSRATVAQVLGALLEADAPGTVAFLRAWAEREVYERPEDGLFFFARDTANRNLMLVDIDTGAEVAEVTSREVNQIRPNAGVRREIGAALVSFELLNPDPARRLAALENIARSPDAEQIEPLQAAFAIEEDSRIADAHGAAA